MGEGKVRERVGVEREGSPWLERGCSLGNDEAAVKLWIAIYTDSELGRYKFMNSHIRIL